MVKLKVKFESNINGVLEERAVGILTLLSVQDKLVKVNLLT